MNTLRIHYEKVSVHILPCDFEYSQKPHSSEYTDTKRTVDIFGRPDDLEQTTSYHLTSRDGEQTTTTHTDTHTQSKTLSIL